MKSQWIRIFFIGEHGKGSTSSKFNTRIGRNQKLGIKLEEEKKSPLLSPSFFLSSFLPRRYQSAPPPPPPSGRQRSI